MASTATINVSVFDGKRNPWTGPAIRLVLTNPFSQTSDKKLTFTIPKATNTILINDVKADAGQVYALLIDADKHRAHTVFPVKPVAGSVTPINIMLIPNKPTPDFSSFSYNELQLRSPHFHSALCANISETDFKGLATTDKQFGPIRMAALLNIEAKLRATELKKGKAVEFIRRIQNLDCCERDRIKADVAPDMPSNLQGLKTFTKLNSDMNEMNHKGFPISFKQKVALCSLQLSFAKTVENGLLSSDIDIDLLTDVGHFGEVLKNKLMKINNRQTVQLETRGKLRMA
jgi:hypothetical protein